MQDEDSKIIALLTDLRDVQREHARFYREQAGAALTLQREQAARQKRAGRLQIFSLVVVLSYLVYFLIKFH